MQFLDMARRVPHGSEKESLRDFELTAFNLLVKISRMEME